jgi:Domain of unknown function (DUF1906)
LGYGVTTSRAHLDVLVEGFPESGEIDWEEVVAWQGEDASFAGRYFLGLSTPAEVDGGIGFCLWAHGEWRDPAAPRTIVPIQRADAERQEATGELGERFAKEDATAISDHLQRCLDVGDLILPADRFLVLVYLEVSAGTALSSEYWSMWAHTMHAGVSEPGPAPVTPWLPGIACAFEESDDGSMFVPEAPVRDRLTEPPRPGRGELCHGLWCTTVLEAPVFGEVIQHPAVGPIPVRYHRVFDGPAGSMTAGAPDAVQATLPLITIDALNEHDDDPLQYALEAQSWEPWAPVPPDTATWPMDLPTQLGLDTAYKWKQDPDTKKVLESTTVAERRVIARCLATKEIVVRRMPAGGGGYDLGTHLDGSELRGRPAFLGRYLKNHFNGLDPVEVADVAATGMSVLSIWQQGHDFKDGAKAGSEAFAAAEKVGQPPYTPVYFAVDVSVDNEGGMHGDIPSPTLSVVLAYFAAIRTGYRNYLAAGGKTPYYVGAYAAHNVLNALYRSGLATHFWQVWAFNWGPPNPPPPDLTQSEWDRNAPGWRAWPHLNAWQVLIEGGLSSLWQDNAELADCADGVIDLNVAWGDPGTWVPAS